MKKILFLMPNKGYSGAEKVVIDIINNLKYKYEFIYVSESGEIDRYLDENKIKHIVTKSNLNIKEIKQIIDNEKPDFIHCTDYRASTKMSFVKTDIPIISHLHNNPLWLKKININSIGYLIASKKFLKILTVSNSIKDEYIFSKFMEKNFQMIGNPISTRDVMNKVELNNQKEYDICFVGRLTEQKNPIRFINIIKKIKQEFPNVKSVMIGDGELKDKCIQEIHKNGLEENIKIAGFLKNPYEEMVKAKIFCLTSDWEGYGLVAFEALTLGLPCIVSNVGGLRGIVDNSCGYLCDSDNEFIDGILLLLKDEEKRNELSINAKKRANELDNIDEYMNEIDKIYSMI